MLVTNIRRESWKSKKQEEIPDEKVQEIDSRHRKKTEVWPNELISKGLHTSFVSRDTCIRI